MRPNHTETPRGQLRLSIWAVTLCALFGLAAIPAVAPAQSSIFDTGSETNVGFVRATADLAGSQARVLVHCNGSAGDACSGTLTLSFSGHKQTAAFSVLAGTTQRVSVPVGNGSRLAGKRAVAVARTTQATGRFSRSSEVLRFR
jgi:hypothetical protein